MSVGAFVAVSGPSGSGKDSILEHARAHYADRADAPRFVCRDITRPAAPGEDHRPVTEREFAAAEERGEYLLSWRAHGLAYGIPARACRGARGDEIVVANLSRAVLPQLTERFPRAFTVLVTVSPAVRAARIAHRGRERGDGASQRIARADPLPGFAYDLTILNDADLASAGDRFIAFLEDVRSGTR